ncbi:MAG: beta-galactosidase [Abditibacteriales bacterium]|nr:beta-galactosidase [Abditibacteriales bacterium]MDW8367674.1 beta-galactosidase [Abditibacteriales bacterium]
MRRIDFGLLCWLMAGTLSLRIAWSQAPALIPLTVTPEVCEKNDTITLTFTLPSPSRRNRFDVVITDAYRGGELARAGREFRPDGGRLRLTQAFRADAGIYAVQVFDGRNPLTEKAYFIVPGMDRVERKEAGRRPRRGDQSGFVDEKDEGWWLVNGYLVSGFISDGSVLSSDLSAWLHPTVKEGFGFNAVMLDPSSKFNLNNLASHGASALASLGSLVGVGLNSINNAPMFNPRGERQNVGCFNAPENRARLLDALKRLQQSVVTDGMLPRAFWGLQIVQPRLPDNTFTCYCSYCAAEFRAFLRERYGDVRKFNARHKLSLQSFADVEPPHPDRSSPSLWNDWQDFRFQIIPRFATWLHGETNKLFPERVLGIWGSSLLGLSAGNVAAGRNPYEGADEWEWGKSKSLDVLGVITSAEDAADRVDLLYAAADVDADGYPNKPVWAAYDAPLARVEAVLHGASGTFAVKGAREHGGDALKDMNRFLNQYANLFIGARAIGEIGVVVPRPTLKYARESRVVGYWEATLAGMQEALRRNHRTKRIIFSEGGIAAQRQPSALFVPLGEMVSDDFLKQLKAFVEEGGAVYLEGLPLRDETGTVVGDRLKDLIGAEVEEVPLRASEMTVDDVWVFGTANKMRLPVQVRGNIKRLLERTPERKGRNQPPEKPRVIATLPDGSPAVIVNELGKPKSSIKGVVVYTPHFVGRDAAMAYLDRVRRTHDPATPFDPRYVDYYGAIADYLSPPLVRLKGDPTSEVRVGALLPNRNVLLIGLINYGAAKKSLELFVRTATSTDGDFQDISIYDLRQQAWLKPLLPQAAVVRLHYELEARDWSMLAFTNYRRTSDFEKFLSEPRFKIAWK